MKAGEFKIENEYLQIAAQNNAIRTDSVKATKSKMQHNDRCKLLWQIGIDQSCNKPIQGASGGVMVSKLG